MPEDKLWLRLLVEGDQQNKHAGAEERRGSEILVQARQQKHKNNSYGDTFEIPNSIYHVNWRHFEFHQAQRGLIFTSSIPASR